MHLEVGSLLRLLSPIYPRELPTAGDSSLGPWAWEGVEAAVGNEQETPAWIQPPEQYLAARCMHRSPALAFAFLVLQFHFGCKRKP